MIAGETREESPSSVVWIAGWLADDPVRIFQLTWRAFLFLQPDTPEHHVIGELLKEAESIAMGKISRHELIALMPGFFDLRRRLLAEAKELLRITKLPNGES